VKNRFLRLSSIFTFYCEIATFDLVNKITLKEAFTIVTVQWLNLLLFFFFQVKFGFEFSRPFVRVAVLFNGQHNFITSSSSSTAK
jgi:hypothetical protein